MSIGTSAGPVPPDWYADPSDPRQMRWWDGTTWTQHTSPAAPPPPPTPAPPPVYQQPVYQQPAVQEPLPQQPAYQQLAAQQQAPGPHVAPVGYPLDADWSRWAESVAQVPGSSANLAGSQDYGRRGQAGAQPTRRPVPVSLGILVVLLVGGGIAAFAVTANSGVQESEASAVPTAADTARFSGPFDEAELEYLYTPEGMAGMVAYDAAVAGVAVVDPVCEPLVTIQVSAQTTCTATDGGLAMRVTVQVVATDGSTSPLLLGNWTAVASDAT